MSDSDIVQDFLVESYENLDRLDRELVGLEKNPHDRDALASVFRTIHTIKGTCGFLGFNKLEKVAHVGENLLTRLRDGQLTLNPELTTALLGMVDAVRQMLKEIQSTGHDGEVDYPELRETLTRLQQAGASVVKHAESTAPQEVPSPTPEKEIAAAVLEAVALPATAGLQKPAGRKRPKAAKLQPAEGIISSPVRAEEPPISRQEDVLASQQALESRSRDKAAETIRVGVNVLDKLMTLVGELVLARFLQQPEFWRLFLSRNLGIADEIK
ncbi:MAG TPA: Hpt domain-containing protein [Terriglobales bacterium]|nr:Hpt domain-containing protein [Terriglobales bacterium]